MERAAQQRIGADEVLADGRGSSPLNSVLGGRGRDLEVPGEDDGYGHRGAWDMDDDPSLAPFSKDQGPATRWNTLASPLSIDVVKERIRRALERRQPFAHSVPLSGSEGTRGFLLKFEAGARILVGEVTLAGWDGGTQVHVAAPAEVKREDVEVLVSLLRRVLR